MNLKVILVMVGVAAISAASFGQGFRGGFGGPGGGSPTMMLMRDDVKTELKLTDEQKAKLQEIQDSTRQQFMDLFQGGGFGQDREAMRKAMEPIIKKSTDQTNQVLTADQQKRLKEIWIQMSGNSTVMNADVQKDLGLTADQKAKIDDLNKRQQAANQEVMEKVRSGEIQREDVRDIMTKNTKVLNDEIGKVLTQAQKDKLKDMGGKPFVATDPAPGGGR